MSSEMRVSNWPGEIVEPEPLNSDRFAKVNELHYDWMLQLALHRNAL
jgi:hypothetical protein